MDEDRANLWHHRTKIVTAQSLTPLDVRDIVLAGGEYALLDMREEGSFSEKRLLLASCLPLSRLEIRAHRLVPRRSVPLIVMDAGDGALAQIGQERLRRLGYEDVRIMFGGVDGWEAAGLPVYSGVNVLTKAFGEVVHTRCRTPDITANELKRWIDEDRNFVILDSRPFHEYRYHTIPGAISVPGAELTARVGHVVPDPATTIVVNCAGRTRSIIGCQSLINAGVPNDVYALRNGTMGWKLAGYELEEGASRSWESSDPVNPENARSQALTIAKRHGVEMVTWADLAQMRADPSRTIYLFDVRTPDEYVAGHVPEVLNAPGGQLVQAFDDYVGVRNGTVVLVDPLQIRAVMTASWLNQIGQSQTLVVSDPPVSNEYGEAPYSGPPLPDVSSIDAGNLARQIDRGEVCVLDLSTSVEYQSGHVPTAFWFLHGRESMLETVTRNAGSFVLVGPDVPLLKLAAANIAAQTGKPVSQLKGGLDAWLAAGHHTEAGMSRPLGPVNDVWYKPYEIKDPLIETDMANSYLEWEVELTSKISADTIEFSPFRSS